jgi:hypothetical protein
MTSPRSELAGSLVVGLLVGSAAAVRPQFGLPLFAFAVVATAWPGGAGILGRLAGLAAGTVLMVGGYAVASLRAAGTPMFPLSPGHLDPTWPANGPAGEGPTIAELIDAVAKSRGVWACVAAVALGVLIAHTGRRHGEVDRAQVRFGVGVIALLAIVAIAWIGALTSYWWTVSASTEYWRFWAPFVWALALVPVAMVGSVGWRSRWIPQGLYLLALALAVSTVAWSPGPFGRSPLRAVTDLTSAPVEGLDGDRYGSARSDFDHAAATIQAGSKVLAAVDAPALLLGKRLVVHTLDLAGSTSPPPHLPYFRGSAAKLSWLRENGYDYVVATAPGLSVCLYDRERWQRNLEGGGLAGAWAPYFLDWFEFLDDARERPTGSPARFGSLLVLRV